MSRPTKEFAEELCKHARRIGFDDGGIDYWEVMSFVRLIAEEAGLDLGDDDLKPDNPPEWWDKQKGTT